MPYLQHSHEGISFAVMMGKSKRGFTVEISAPEKKRVEVATKQPIDGMIPSVDGSVLFVLLSDGSQLFFDTTTGGKLTKNKVADRGAQFYQ